MEHTNYELTFTERLFENYVIIENYGLINLTCIMNKFAYYVLYCIHTAPRFYLGEKER